MSASDDVKAEGMQPLSAQVSNWWFALGLSIGAVVGIVAYVNAWI